MAGASKPRAAAVERPAAPSAFRVALLHPIHLPNLAGAATLLAAAAEQPDAPYAFRVALLLPNHLPNMAGAVTPRAPASERPGAPSALRVASLLPISTFLIWQVLDAPRRRRRAACRAVCVSYSSAASYS
jgi:hypothetical protein